MKITIKIDPETLFLLHKVILEQTQMIANNVSAKVAKSMRIELFEILVKRCITYTSKADGKKMSLTIRYHLAEMLYKILCDLHYSMGVYEANKLDMFKNQLHQKLL